MKFKKLLPFLAAATLVVGVTVPLVVTSCSSSTPPPQQDNKTKQILDINKKYIDNESQFVSADSGLPKFSEPANQKANNLLIPSFQSILDNSSKAIEELNNFKKNNNLDQDQTIWIDSYIFQWNNKVQNIKSGMVFLGQNPLVSAARPLSTSANHIRDNISSSVNIYPINPETGDPDKTKDPDKELLNSLVSRIKGSNQLVKDYKSYLDFGSKNFGIQPSTISKKLLINQLLGFFFTDRFDVLASDSRSEFTMSDIIPEDINQSKYFKALLDDYKAKAPDAYNSINTELTALYKSLRDFMIFYAGAYYSNTYSFGPKQTTEFKLTKTENGEVEKTIIAANGTKLYGAGLTMANLNEKNVGIGFMNIQAANVPEGFVKNGNDLYQQMLNNNNSINDKAADIFKLGVQLTKDGLNNMKEIARQSEQLIVNGLTGQIDYDPDGIGPNPVKKLTLEGETFTKFNQWLNQEDFFWGRETFDTPEELNQFIDKYWNNVQGEELTKYKNIIIEQGYETNWKNKSTINGQQTGTVTGNQALAGAVLSLKDYIGFKVATDKVFDPNFNPIDDYIISPYNYNIREDVGVGLEGPRGSKQFQYNCDPYYSLPKWSVSSLTNHEGKMGHHTQQQYWTQYLKGGDGSSGEGPGYTFVNDAFHEGWAVFAEWFGNELEVFGTQLDPTTRIPTNWLNAKGLVPQYNKDNVTNLTAAMKDLHGGVYYDKVKGTDGSDEKLQNSIKLANMLQYYGFLNEAQLRNMRLGLDVAYHYKSETPSSETGLPFGASINDVRNYMKTNSALSIGDINSESIRYLAIPSQATGYMLGKRIFEDLYKAVESKLNKGALVDNKEEVKKLFDLMLRNGEIPLEVMKEQVNLQYGIKSK